MLRRKTNPFGGKETHPFGKKDRGLSGKRSDSFLGAAADYFARQEEKIKKSQKKQFSFFVLGFLIFYLLISWVVSLAPATMYEAATGTMLRGLLGAQGIPSAGYIMDNYLIAVQGKEIIISWLCSGVMEIIVLISAILASFGVSWKKKAIGVAIAVPTGYLFNVLRVWITTNIILTQPIQVIELTHDVLFRVFLFIYIMIFYVVWFYLSARKGESHSALFRKK